DNAGAKGGGFTVSDGNALVVCNGLHTRHDKLALFVVFIFEHLHGTLATCADRTKGGMPAEIGHVESEGEARLQKVFSRRYLIGLVVNVQRRHSQMLSVV